MDRRVKISLCTKNGRSYRLLARSALNNGRYAFVLPAKIPSGEYIIEISTLDGSVKFYSEVFRIK